MFDTDIFENQKTGCAEEKKPHIEPFTRSLNFKTETLRMTPTFCPVCMGSGLIELGTDTCDCKICKGTGRNEK